LGTNTKKYPVLGTILNNEVFAFGGMQIENQHGIYGTGRHYLFLQF